MLLGSPLILPGHGTRTPQLHSEGCSPRLNIRDSQSIHEWHAPHSLEINCSPCPGARCRRRTGVRVTAVAELARPVVTTKPQSNKVLVRMSVPFRVAFGQVIKVVGSAKEFGAWDVSAAPRFEWTEGDIWVGNFSMDPGLYEYKVVIFNEQSQESRWESGINRVVEVPKGPGTLTTSCYWGAPSTQGWFDKGEVDSSIKITKLDKAPIKAIPQGPPAVLLQKGWDAMYERSKSPERERSLTPELARPSARRTTPRVGGSSGASVRPSKWASVVDKEEALEEAVRAMKAKKKTLPTVSKPVRSDSGAVREGRDKDSAATLAGRALRDDITELYEHGGERVMRSLSGMLSNAQGSGVVRDGLRQLKNLESHVVLRNMRDALSDGGSELMRGGLKQLREVDSRVVFKNVRDAVNSLANSEETAHLQRMGRKQSSIVPSQVLEEGERFFKAVSSVVSTKSPSAIRGEAIDEEALKESYRRKKPLTATASRRPTPEPVPGRADPIGRLRASQEALARSASAVGKTTTTTGSSSTSRSSSRSPSPEPTRHLELPKIELPAVGITLDTSFLSGAALVAAVVLSVLTTDTHGIRSTLIGRADALKAALVEPLPPKVSGKTPKPSRAASPASPAKPQGQAAKPAAQSQAAQAKSTPAAKPAASSQAAQPAQAKSTAASSAAPKPPAPGQPAEARK